MASKLEHLVVSLEWAKQLPPASFSTTLFVWEVPVDGKPVVRESSYADCTTTNTIKGRPGHKWYPAPTLHEIMLAVKRLAGKPNPVLCMLDFFNQNIRFECRTYKNHASIGCLDHTLTAEDQMAWLWVKLYKERRRRREEHDLLRKVQQ